MAGTSPGSNKWPTLSWQKLLHDAIYLLDGLRPPPSWSFGGGTALAVFYDHRISYDVDLFVKSADTLRDLSPGRNAATKALLDGRQFQFPGNYLKLEMAEGEIDFIVGSHHTCNPTQPWVFEGREIAIETPWETAIRKIFYRSSTFKVRDVFDLAAVIENDGENLKSNLNEVEDRLDRLIDRLDALSATYEKSVVNDVNPTDKGRPYASAKAIQSTLSFLSEWRNQRS